MASPFVDDTVELGARIVRGALRRERIFRERLNPLAFPEEYLYERYRFSSEGLTYLCQLLEPYIANATHRSCALTVPPTLCIALRYFATGSFLYAVGDAENLSKNAVCRAIHKVAHALTGLVESFVVFPGICPTQTIKERFYSMAGFPRVLGCIDCTHVPISASLGENEGDYVNRKSIHSLNIQATCDHRGIITSLVAKWPGSVHDSRIFAESSLCHKLEQGLFSGVLLGDRGYACQPFLMTPYPDPGEGPQTSFNVAHAKTRVQIEMTFGILKARFTCLRGLRVAPERACRIITACVVLHNIATMRKERAPPADPQPPDVVDPITLDYPTGRAVRDAIALTFAQ
ncbi:putative nuclease HARBI1 [Pseudochaenichthys georgianus]|uniref:putative nuclease HARBI1 n=1 Tax=Pseudochaenichthys georgianus TaxID=52239 RepID=UPI00146D6911|nr:putative nuclease HARBI1 [Pseudochaenichthys georgianus]